METDVKLSKVQQAIREDLESFIDRMDKALDITRDHRLSNVHNIQYCFHDDKSISVDCDLYDILYYGCADYNYGSELYIKIHEIVKKLGYYLEYEGQGVYNIGKV